MVAKNIHDHSKIHEIRECFLPWMIPNIWYYFDIYYHMAWELYSNKFLWFASKLFTWKVGGILILQKSSFILNVVVIYSRFSFGFWIIFYGSGILPLIIKPYIKFYVKFSCHTILINTLSVPSKTLQESKLHVLDLCKTTQQENMCNLYYI